VFRLTTPSPFQDASRAATNPPPQMEYPVGRPTETDRTAARHAAGTERPGTVIRGLLKTGWARPRRIAMLVDTGEFVRLERRTSPGWGDHVVLAFDTAKAREQLCLFQSAVNVQNDSGMDIKEVNSAVTRCQVVAHSRSPDPAKALILASSGIPTAGWPLTPPRNGKRASFSPCSFHRRARAGR
jgi:hypothetical protein